LRKKSRSLEIACDDLGSEVSSTMNRQG
jgi:hypothetical protein